MNSMIVVRMTPAQAAEIVAECEGMWLRGAARELVEKLMRELAKGER